MKNSLSLIALILVLLINPAKAVNNITEFDISKIEDLSLTKERSETMYLINDDKSITLVKEFLLGDSDASFQFIKVNAENEVSDISEQIPGSIFAERIYKNSEGNIITARDIEFDENQNTIKSEIIKINSETGELTVLGEFSHINDFFLRSDEEFYVVGNTYTGQHQVQDKVLLYDSTTEESSTLLNNKRSRCLFELQAFQGKFLLVSSKDPGGENPERIDLMRLRLNDKNQLKLKRIRNLYSVIEPNRAIFDLRFNPSFGRKSIYFFTSNVEFDEASLYKVNSKNKKVKKLSELDNSSISLHNSQDFLYLGELIPRPESPTMLRYDKANKHSEEVVLPFNANKIDILSGFGDTLVIENLGPGNLELPDLNLNAYILNNEEQ